MKIRIFFIFYLISLFFISIYLLNFKFLYPTDWTTSEWLINYQGGFVRRGLSGEILFQINKIINLHPRFLVYYFQILLLFIFYVLFYFYIKKIKFNYYLLILFLCPALLLFPLAANDVLVRKETLLFIIYIFFLKILSKSINKCYIFLFFILPIMNLIWDGIIFYIFFFISTLFIYTEERKEKINFFKLLFCFLPYLISLYFVLSNNTSIEQIRLICLSLNENCYGAIEALDKSLKWQINYQTSRFQIFHLFKIVFILILSFLPFFLIFYKISNKKKNLVIFLSFAVSIFPTLIFFIIGFDWGRWINISYTLCFLKLCFLLKENILATEDIYLFEYIENKFRNKNKFLLILIFIYLISWYNKSLMTDNIGTLPYLRIANKIKKTTNYDLNY